MNKNKKSLKLSLWIVVFLSPLSIETATFSWEYMSAVDKLESAEFLPTVRLAYPKITLVISKIKSLLKYWITERHWIKVVFKSQ